MFMSLKRQYARSEVISASTGANNEIEVLTEAAGGKAKRAFVVDVWLVLSALYG